jgi:SAM-dependent methyltransferase
MRSPIRPPEKQRPDGRVAGSFRDPSGYVFSREGRLYRAVDAECAAVLRDLQTAGLLDKLIAEGGVVATSFVTEAATRAALQSEHPPFTEFLEHQRLSPVTYPAEWSVSMLADAGIATLSLQRRLLPAGFSLKDATAYNLLFDRGRPVFIDLGSIERPARLDLWPALGQFGPMFTFPLLLAVHHGHDLRTIFLSHLGGVGLESAAKLLGRSGRLRPRAWLDVTLPAFLGRKKLGRQVDANEVLAKKGSGDPKAVLMNLGRLERKLARLAARFRPSGVWADYKEICTYDDDATRAKHAHVRAFLEEHRPETVLDLGCNTGDYSLLAAECGARVLAVDGDHDAVEVLYRRVRDDRLPITPAVVDLGNPTPGMGFLNRERESFLERGRSDCVFALALVHHLMVTGNLPLSHIRELLAALTRRYAVVEFIPGDDPMFRELLKRRVGPMAAPSLEEFREGLAESFELLREEAVPGANRTLLFLKLRSADA